VPYIVSRIVTPLEPVVTSGFFPPGGVTLEPFPALEGTPLLGLETVLALGVLEVLLALAPGLVTLLALPGRLLTGVLEVGAVTLEAVIVVLL
jgi:hypothetical protein